MFTNIPLDPLAGRGECTRRVAFTAAQDKVLRKAYLLSTLRLPQNRGLSCHWSHFHKIISNSEAFSHEELGREGGKTFLLEQRATVLGAKEDLVEFKEMEEIKFTMPLTRAWDPPNFFGSAPKDDPENPFFKQPYKGLKVVYRNTEDQNQSQHLLNLSPNSANTNSDSDNNSNTKRFRTDETSSIDPKRPKASTPPPSAPSPPPSPPSPTPPTCLPSPWSRTPFTPSVDSSILSAVNKINRKPNGAIRWVQVLKAISSISETYGSQNVILRYNQLKVTQSPPIKSTCDCIPFLPLTSPPTRVFALWSTSEYDVSDKFYGQPCQGWIVGKRVRMGEKQVLVHFNDEDVYKCGDGKKAVGDIDQIPTFQCVCSNQWIDESLVQLFEYGYDELCYDAGNMKTYGVTPVQNGWRRNWVTGKTGGQLFGCLTKAKRTYDEIYVMEEGKKVQKRKLNKVDDWEDLGERPKRIHGKEDVVRHLLPEGNAVEDIPVEDIPVEKVAEKQPDFPDFSSIVGEEVAKTVYKGEDEQYYFLVDGVSRSLREICLEG
ncbi:hypothetical protein TrVE_jg2545 [Triparma verrucosa]|uniref:Uncharacterized protein n=1 Tax=Triparma verrucosa TaxID=1606542 RepID=A0A9W7C6J4_9STRA|nr:hypothetical protein TrVE_jg2545 [Triparma verrucosa]